jgi:hypothetical protein
MSMSWTSFYPEDKKNIALTIAKEIFKEIVIGNENCLEKQAERAYKAGWAFADYWDSQELAKEASETPYFDPGKDCEPWEDISEVWGDKGNGGKVTVFKESPKDNMRYAYIPGIDDSTVAFDLDDPESSEDYFKEFKLHK